MVQREKAERLLSSLLDALADLARYRDRVGLDDLRRDRDVQNMVLRALYVAVQSCIDLGFHVAGAKRLPQATTYQEVFLRLDEAGLLAPDLALRLSGWAGFRNVLAHFYPVIDFDRVHATLRSDLPDLEAFAAVVAGMLEEEE
jgi:uncharacterized protein YutE (UPF0331/DUF86 family)